MADEFELEDIVFEEALFDIAFHPTHNLIASALITGQVAV
jgi:hypothetical protein